MNDGSALSGTYTLTNASAIVQGNSSVDSSEIAVGDVVIDDHGDKVRVADIQPARTVATSAVNASNEQITITDHGFVANQEVHYKANGGTAIAGLTDETTFFVKTVASANAFTLSATEGGALIDITGTGNNAQFFELLSATQATAGAAMGTGAAGDQGSSAAHSGWIRRKELTGAHAGRVQYEVLVALSKNGITSDAADDTQFSE